MSRARDGVPALSVEPMMWMIEMFSSRPNRRGHDLHVMGSTNERLVSFRCRGRAGGDLPGGGTTGDPAFADPPRGGPAARVKTAIGREEAGSDRGS